MSVHFYFMSHSVLAKQKDDRFYAPANYCFWLHPLQIAKTILKQKDNYMMPLASNDFLMTVYFFLCPTVCSQSKRMTDFMLLRATASGCILLQIAKLAKMH